MNSKRLAFAAVTQKDARRGDICCRLQGWIVTFRLVRPWHRAIPACFFANDRHPRKLFEPGGRPFLPYPFSFCE
jgi:hypothetical protein